MIRKLIVSISLLVFCVGVIQAQEKKEFKPEWQIGIGGGPTFSSVDFHAAGFSTVPTKNLMQFFGGVSVRYLSENHLGLIGEINYSQQGWEGKYEGNPEFMHKHKLNYIDIPLMTHIYFGRKFRFFINLGPKISFLLSDKEEISDALKNYLSSGNMSSSVATGHYYRKAEKKFDFGLVAGLGVELRTKIGDFALEGRYNFSFGDIYKNSTADPFDRSSNRVIGAKLTYYVNLF